MIAYAFPPEGHAGVYRPLRFVRHLPDMGWSPIVITGDPGRYGYIRHDPHLVKLVPEDTTVVRVTEHDPWQLLQAYRARYIGEKLSAFPSKAPLSGETQRQPIRALIRGAVRKIEACCYHPDMAMGWIIPAINASV